MIAYLLTALILAAVALVNIRIFRSTISLGMWFSAFWAALLLVLALAGDRFYSVPARALIIYGLGAIGFSAGGAAAAWLTSRLDTDAVAAPGGGDDAYFRFIARLGLFVGLTGLPFYVRYVVSLAKIGGGNGFLYSVRRGSIALGERPIAEIHYTPADVYLVNLPYIVLFFALVALVECRERAFLRRYAAVLVASSAVYGLLTASIGPLINVLGGVLGIVMVQRRAIPIRVLIATAAMFLAGFLFLAVTTKKIGSLLDVLLLYLVGGLVAFGVAVEHPEAVAPNWSIWRFFETTLSKLGIHYDVPSLHLSYVPVSPTAGINVYTMYFAYYPAYGYAGVFVLCALAGFAGAVIFSRAMRGEHPWQIGYGLLFSCILTSAFNEPFWMNLNFLLKAALFMAIVYVLPSTVLRNGRRRTFVAG